MEKLIWNDTAGSNFVCTVGGDEELWFRTLQPCQTLSAQVQASPQGDKVHNVLQMALPGGAVTQANILAVANNQTNPQGAPQTLPMSGKIQISPASNIRKVSGDLGFDSYFMVLISTCFLG